MKFIWPPFIGLFLFIATKELLKDPSDSFHIFFLGFVLCIAVGGFFTIYFRSSEVWISGDSLVVYERKKERIIKLTEVRRVEAKRFSRGCPVVIWVRQRPNVYFYPKDVFFPFMVPEIVKKLKELTNPK